ncbi:MAG: GNAT family N-acetyltransferase [Rhodoferax sp.]|nr:GNAT family N-acetyltransferase [Rhodoferax sp.]
MTQFLIRPAARNDAEAITRIHASTGILTGLQPTLDAQVGAAPTPQQLRFWRDAIEFSEPQLHVASTVGQVVGVVGFDRSRDAGTAPTMGEIWTIQVLPAYWNEGAGLALWDTAREELIQEGCTEVSIWIDLTNDRALRFHALAGFKRVMSSARSATVHGVRTEQIRLKRKLLGS